jgi:hypothetical protein
LFPFQPNQFDAFHLAMQLLRDPNAATQVLQPVHRFTVDTFKITGCWLLWRKQGIVSRPSAGALDPAIIGKAGRKTVLPEYPEFVTPFTPLTCDFGEISKTRWFSMVRMYAMDESIIDVSSQPEILG